MSRSLRALSLAVLVLALGFSTPAQAQVPSFTPIGPVVRPFCNVTLYGFGQTSTEALNNAVAEAKSKYFVFSYTVLESRCDQIEIPDPTPLNPGHTRIETICWVELKICGIRKVVWNLP